MIKLLCELFGIKFKISIHPFLSCITCISKFTKNFYNKKILKWALWHIQLQSQNRPSGILYSKSTMKVIILIYNGKQSIKKFWFDDLKYEFLYDSIKKIQY